MKPSRVSGSKFKWMSIRVLFAVAIISIVVVTLRRQLTASTSAGELTLPDDRAISVELMDEKVVNMEESEEEGEEEEKEDREASDEEEIEFDSESDSELEDTDESEDAENLKRGGKGKEDEEDEEDEDIEEDRKAIKGLGEEEEDDDISDDSYGDKQDEEDEKAEESEGDESTDGDEEDMEEDEDKAQYKDDNDENKSTGERILGSFLSMFGSGKSKKDSSENDKETEGKQENDDDKDSKDESNEKDTKENEDDNGKDTKENEDDNEKDTKENEDGDEEETTTESITIVKLPEKDQAIHNLGVMIDGVDSQDYNDSEDIAPEQAGDIKIESTPPVVQGQGSAQAIQGATGQVQPLRLQIQSKVPQGDSQLQQQQLQQQQQQLQQQQQQQQLQQQQQQQLQQQQQQQQQYLPSQQQGQQIPQDQNMTALHRQVKEFLSPAAYNLLMSKKVNFTNLPKISGLVGKFLLQAGYPKDAEIISKIGSLGISGNNEQISRMLPQGPGGQQPGGAQSQYPNTGTNGQMMPSQSEQKQLPQQLNENAGTLVQPGVKGMNGEKLPGQQQAIAQQDFQQQGITQSGQETDSIYNIMASLKNGNAAGVYQMSKKVAIETHAPSDRNFERAILVIGNPYAVEAGHRIFRPFSVEWQKNFLWERTYTAWLSSSLPLHVISYEDLVEAPLTEIIKLASFVGGEGVELNYDCALSAASTSPPMVYDVTQITGVYRTERRRINTAVDNVAKAAAQRGFHAIIPRLESFKLYAGL
ncbi:hypothetical protein ElyMa_004671300 [Elysia marginata]|uniref:Uncharacterized protein n=1 Tax=Elysia marginata TaxID=1093978 RepID=A0AAV4I7N3_9GAST|nr:hypothetical protein ElyMa_004671300 [Elysia marginata]